MNLIENTFWIWMLIWIRKVTSVTWTMIIHRVVKELWKKYVSNNFCRNFFFEFRNDWRWWRSKNIIWDKNDKYRHYRARVVFWWKSLQVLNVKDKLCSQTLLKSIIESLKSLWEICCTIIKGRLGWYSIIDRTNLACVNISCIRDTIDKIH